MKPYLRGFSAALFLIKVTALLFYSPKKEKLAVISAETTASFYKNEVLCEYAGIILNPIECAIRSAAFHQLRMAHQSSHHAPSCFLGKQ